jgi:hypothetical protein
MKQLIEDYKRRLKNIDEVIKEFKSNGSVNDLKKEVRLNTKASEYRTFIVELEHALSEKENVKSPWGVIVQGENVQPDTIQPDQTPKLVSLIDFSLLRTQKKTLIEIIDDMEKRGVEPERVSDLSGILNLIDSIQDFAVDVMGLNPIDVFNFELEESREDVTKTITLCKECNTDDVTIKTKNSGYCMICGKEVEIYKATLNADAKVIGYQVLGMAGHENDGHLHPEMSASFALYSLKQARKMLSSNNTMYTNEWVIVSIWSGDIEEPTFMFRGNPDNNHKK